jgi:2-polyprenyl-3-methyl-5-hydroxy-6-metoxy-1,4-benzoquinol methylase
MALTWSLALLSAYPQARQRLEDEVDAVLGDGPPDPDKLPWTTAVISEAMRLYPPAWTIERTAVADDDVCGTPVPAGSMVAILPYLIHRNPAVWPNPAGFDPGRFLPGTPDRHRYAWIPFGGGKRGCIGAGFARLEAVLVLARLCRHYRLDLTGPALPRARGFVTLRPAGPVRMRLTRRGWLAHHAQNGSGNTVRPEDLYAGTPPWDIGRPQPAFLNLAREGAIQGRVLHAGCGTGEHSLMAASLGLDTTGIDLSASALRAAEHKARQRGLTVRFLQWDALRLTELGESFDTVLDCGLFHILDGPDRAAYIRGLRAALIPGGRLFMLCLSDAQPPGDWGRAHRVSMGEIITAFADKWQVGSIEPATLDITGSPARIRAWLAAITRT